MKIWEVSLIEFKNDEKKGYKITRRIPEMSISETKIFSSKKKAMQQFQEWSE
jgi:hypothetical protein